MTFSSSETWAVNLSTIFFRLATTQAMSSTSTWASFRATFSSASSDFRDTRYLEAESLSLGSMPSVVCYSMKTVRQKGGGEFKVSLEHHSGIIGFEGD
jgi:hypothetical protein